MCVLLLWYTCVSWTVYELINDWVMWVSKGRATNKWGECLWVTSLSELSYWRKLVRSVKCFSMLGECVRRLSKVSVWGEISDVSEVTECMYVS